MRLVEEIDYLLEQVSYRDIKDELLDYFRHDGNVMYDFAEFKGKENARDVEPDAYPHPIFNWAQAHDDYERYLESWTKKYFDKVLRDIQSLEQAGGNRVVIWRGLSLRKDPDEWLSHLAGKAKRLGEYWTSNRKSTKRFLEGRNTALIKTEINLDHIDWTETIKARMIAGTGDIEQEINLYKGTPLKIKAIWINGEKVELPDEVKRKTFKA